VTGPDTCELLCLDLPRAAGLVRSRRDTKMVMYALTSGGAALLAAVIPLPEKVPA
jgi:hypothetical protein